MSSRWIVWIAAGLVWAAVAAISIGEAGATVYVWRGPAGALFITNDADELPEGGRPVREVRTASAEGEGEAASRSGRTAEDARTTREPGAADRTVASAGRVPASLEQEPEQAKEDREARRARREARREARRRARAAKEIGPAGVVVDERTASTQRSARADATRRPGAADGRSSTTTAGRAGRGAGTASRSGTTTGRPDARELFFAAAARKEPPAFIVSVVSPSDRGLSTSDSLSSPTGRHAGLGRPSFGARGGGGTAARNPRRAPRGGGRFAGM